MANPHSNPGAAKVRQTGHANDRGLTHAFFPDAESDTLREHVNDVSVSLTTTSGAMTYVNDSVLGLYHSRTTLGRTGYIFTDAQLGGLKATINAATNFSFVARARMVGAIASSYPAFITGVAGLRQFDLMALYGTTSRQIIQTSSPSNRLDYPTLTTPFAQDQWFTFGFTLNSATGEGRTTVNGALVRSHTQTLTAPFAVTETSFNAFGFLAGQDAMKFDMSYCAIHDVLLTDDEMSAYSNDVFAGWRVSGHGLFTRPRSLAALPRIHQRFGRPV